MVKKYIFTGETKIVDDVVVHRIKAVRDIETNRGIVKAGKLGGWIEKESNLSHDGGCWVFDEACVYGDACVYEEALVCEGALIYENANICGNALVRGNAQIYGNSWVYERARVCGDAQIYGGAWVHGNSQVYGDAQIYGNSCVLGEAKVCGDAVIRKTSDYLTIGPIGSRDDYTTFFKGADGDIYVACGCFRGNLEEFTNKVKEKYSCFCKYGAVYMNAAHMAANQLDWKDEKAESTELSNK